jgi:hypothetical protein
MNTDHDETGQQSGAEAGQQPLTPAQTEWTIPRRLRTSGPSRRWFVEAGLSLACFGIAVLLMQVGDWWLTVPMSVLVIALVVVGLVLMIVAAKHAPQRRSPWLYVVALLQGLLVFGLVSWAAGFGVWK